MVDKEGISERSLEIRNEVIGDLGNNDPCACICAQHMRTWRAFNGALHRLHR
jgi:hypothetical protein